MPGSRPATLRTRTSAGGVVHRKSDGKDVEVALIQPRGSEVWTLPKGLMEEHETPEAAALREVGEETGIKASVLSDLGSRTYWYRGKGENVKYRKTVRYFLMNCLEDSGNKQDEEVQEVQWLTLTEAMATATYKSDREIIEEAGRRIKSLYATKPHKGTGK